MTKQVFWTKKVVEEFIKEGNLNERQEYIVRTRAKEIIDLLNNTKSYRDRIGTITFGIQR